MPSKFPLVWVLGATLALGGCFDELDDEGSNDLGGGSTLNQVPTIAGAPPSNVLEGEFYEFRPDATDPDGDALEFSIARKPVWAQFDKSSGRLWGTPGANDVGNFTNIAISVSDGKAEATLAAFDVSVSQVAAGAATLSWNPPTENADGSALTNLAGYRIYYGRNADNLTQVVVLDNPGLTRYVVENLTPARWHFEMTSVNAEGVESRRTPTASKTIG
jgi:Putative Ig domain